MSMMSGNGKDLFASWEPASPFLSSPAREESALGPRVSAHQESPFVYHELRGAMASTEPEAETEAEDIAELLSELECETFDEAASELIHELGGVAGSQMQGELGEARSDDVHAEMMLSEYLEPLARAAEERVMAIAEAIGPLDLESVDERELDAALDRSAGAPVLSPSSQGFLMELEDKVKRGVRRRARRARQRRRPRGGFLLKMALKKLGALVRPLLRKVLAHALHKLPAVHRAAARRLAARMGPGKQAKHGTGDSAARDATPAAGAEPRGGGDADGGPASRDGADADGGAADRKDGGAADRKDAKRGAPSEDAPAGEPPDDAGARAKEPGTDAAPPEPASAPVEAVQSELDVAMTELLLARDEAEQDAVVREVRALAEQPAGDPLGELERGRMRFLRALHNLRQGEDAGPAVEQFVPVILAAIKLGVRLIGRPRVVGFLGGLIGKLIAPIAGKEMGPKLGRAIADVGLRVLFHAEVGAQDELEAAGHAVASTVEETVRRVAALPDHVLANETLLEASVLGAFEQAAAASIPPSLVRPELRESEAEAVWIPIPRSGRATFRKFSRVFDVRITTQMAARVRTFGGHTLAAFFRDRLRLAHQPVHARVHLYETRLGGRLGDIAQHDRVRGLGAPGDATSRLHPLTHEAAGILLQEPGLGRPSHGGPLHPRVGDRAYFLEIVDAPPSVPGRASSLAITVDFPDDAIRARIYLAEAVAQDIATLLRKSARPAVVIKRLREVLGPVAATIDSDRGLRFVLAHHLRVHLSFRTRVGEQVIEWLWIRLAEYIEQSAAELVTATEHPADGVTILVTFDKPPGLHAARAALGGDGGASHAWPPRQVPQSTVRVHAAWRDR